MKKNYIKKLKKNKRTRISKNKILFYMTWKNQIYENNFLNKDFFSFLRHNFQCKFKKKDVKKCLSKPQPLIKFYRKNFVRKKKIKKFQEKNFSNDNNYYQITVGAYKNAFKNQNKLSYNAYKKKYSETKSNFINYSMKQLIVENNLKNFVNIEGEKDFIFANSKIPIIKIKRSFYSINTALINKFIANNVKKWIKKKNKYINKYENTIYYGASNMYKKRNGGKNRIPIRFKNLREIPKTLFTPRQVYDNRSYRSMRRNYKNNIWTNLRQNPTVFFWKLYFLDITKKETYKKKYKKYRRWFPLFNIETDEMKIAKKINEKKERIDPDNPDSLKNQITKRKKTYKPIKVLGINSEHWESKFWHKIFSKHKKNNKRRRKNYRSWTQFSKLHIRVYKDALINKGRGTITYWKRIKSSLHARIVVKSRIQKKRFRRFINKETKRLMFYYNFFLKKK